MQHRRGARAAADRANRTAAAAEPRPAAMHRPRASPAARRLAAERGIALAGLTGSGPGGAIQLADVERAAAAALASASAKAPRSWRDAPGDRRGDGALKARDPALLFEHDHRPHRALAWLEATNATRPPAQRLLLAALLLKAVARALGEAPEFNGFFTAEGFQPGAGIHVGTAIAIRGGGLVAPAIRDADKLSLDELMAQLRDLVARARSGALRSSELSDPTITVTNLGERSVETVFGVIYPPQVALVGFGMPVERPWAVGGAGRRPARADGDPRRRPPRQRRPPRRVSFSPISTVDCKARRHYDPRRHRHRPDR